MQEIKIHSNGIFFVSKNNGGDSGVSFYFPKWHCEISGTKKPLLHLTAIRRQELKRCLQPMPDTDNIKIHCLMPVPTHNGAE